jgi:signal peptidase I
MSPRPELRVAIAGWRPPARIARGARAARPWLVRALRAAPGLALGWMLLFHVSVVRGSSMLPGIEDGDRILVSPWSYAFEDVRRGDVVVLQCPSDARLDYIKRVVALPGDLVAMAGGELWVNGERADESYLAAIDPESWCVTRVPDRHVFVLGDNRPRSSDSRDFGPVPAEAVRGRVEWRLWPPARAGRVE